MIVLTDGLIDLINNNWHELDCMPEDLFPGVNKAISKLNVQTGVSSKDEGFAGWIYGISSTGQFMVTVDQPYYVSKLTQKCFFFDGKKFV